MFRKYGVFILAVFVIGLITFYFEKSPTAKLVMKTVKESLPDEKEKKHGQAPSWWLTKDDTIHFLGISAVISRDGTILLDHGAIETAGRRILKQPSGDQGFEIYGSSINPDNYLAVYDVSESLPATVNRHLRNHVMNNIMGSDYENTDLNLEGYSILLFYYKSKDGRYHEITEARWIPTELRESELQYERYEKGLDLDMKRDHAVNNEYSNDADRSDMEQQFREQRRLRAYKAREQYLLRDSLGKAEVLPLIE